MVQERREVKGWARAAASSTWLADPFWRWKSIEGDDFSALVAREPLSLAEAPAIAGQIPKVLHRSQALEEDALREAAEHFRGDVLELEARAVEQDRLVGAVQAVGAVSYTHLTLPTKA